MASFERIVFKTIDVLFNLSQNYYKCKNVHVEKDIVYDPDYPDICALDIYRHENKVGVKIPTIINYHGGGYMAGGREYRTGIASYLVDKLDVCVINLSYHLCENAHFPQFTKDSVKALEWVAAHAEEYAIDLDNLYIMGDSAGAQIAAHAITIVQNETLSEVYETGRPNLSFKGALLFCGPYDVMTALTNKNVPFDFAHGIGNRVLGFNTRKKGAFDDFKYKDYINVLDWISPSFPPSFVCHTVGDVFCLGQGEKMIEKLAKNGVPYVSYYSAKKADFHCWYLNLQLRSSKKVLKALVEYMKKRLAGEIPPCQRIVYGSQKELQKAQILEREAGATIVETPIPEEAKKEKTKQ